MRLCYSLTRKSAFLASRSIQTANLNIAHVYENVLVLLVCCLSLSVRYKYRSCTIFHVYKVVSVLSCFHVRIDCKNTLLVGGNNIYLCY